jgi:GNAT superfamily N-acetyltransferase
VLAALLAALTASWQNRQTTGSLVRWPSADRWIASALVKEGFLLDSYCAYTPTPPAPSARSLPSDLRIRSARPEDERALIALFREELAFHQACIPFARLSPRALEAFQEKLARLWKGEPLKDGAPLVLVVERQSGQILAMAENTLLCVSAHDEPGFTPPGLYGCIDNMIVSEEERGMGIGRLLADAVFAAFAPLQLGGYLLWYNPGNVPASHFWPRLGFEPLWTTYQRLH